MLEFISMFFNKIWSLFSIKWPGFDFPVWAAFLGVAFSVIALSLIGRLFNISLGSALSDVFSSASRSVKGGNNRKIKITDKRKGDTH